MEWQLTGTNDADIFEIDVSGVPFLLGAVDDTPAFDLTFGLCFANLDDFAGERFDFGIRDVTGRLPNVISERATEAPILDQAQLTAHPDPECPRSRCGASTSSPRSPRSTGPSSTTRAPSSARPTA